MTRTPVRLPGPPPRFRPAALAPRLHRLTRRLEGRPNPDRTWTECFAQLVGTVLSLWDAAELDAAGQDGEVLPKFINLTDASIKMVGTRPACPTDDSTCTEC